MANTHTTLNSLFTDIADAIRSKTGSTSTITADNFPSAIENIQSYKYNYLSTSAVQMSGQYLRLVFNNAIEDGSTIFGAASLRSNEGSLMIMFDSVTVSTTSQNIKRGLSIMAPNGTIYAGFDVYIYGSNLYISNLSDIMPTSYFDYNDGFIFSQ